MNNKIIIGIVVLVVVGGGIFFVMSKSNKTQQQNNTSQTQPATQQTTAKNAVTIANMGFSPDTLTVKVGDKVTWTNQDSVEHTATADDNSFDTGAIAQGQSRSITFSKAGTYTYHCNIHPSMKAKIIVE